MFEIDKAEFGSFVSALRKEKGMTQKELAARLFVSDKAVSKWETGQSIPDVALLVPLAEILGVTVTELLECHRIENHETINSDEVEKIVQKAVALGEKNEKRQMAKGRSLRFFIGAIVISVLQFAGMLHILPADSILIYNTAILVGISAFFGVYFFFFTKDRLPSYYDDNRISCYSDGAFRINMPGVYFNNSNWPHILKSIRKWTVVTVATAPAAAVAMLVCVYAVMKRITIQLAIPFRIVGNWEMAVSFFVLAVYLGSLMAAIYIPARKYDNKH